MNSLCRYVLAVMLFFIPTVSIAMKIPAPEIPTGLDWLNIDQPLTLQQLRGKFVLLDFWTYCCINCMHIIPDLQKLEAKYPNELVVIGVHSAKFNAEGNTDNIREAVLRYGIEHPVVNDPELLTWREYVINSWPTTILIDPDGFIIARKSGEEVFGPMDAALQASIPQFTSQLNRTPLILSLEKNKKTSSILDFPGKISSDPEGKRLFISDSGHNRIIITSLDGQIIDIIGNGGQGRRDGKFNEAQFVHPQGTAYANNYLYIADTYNHLIRRADLINKTVTTIAGTGDQGFDRAANGRAMKIPLSSPWDIVVIEGQMYIAMAGMHQIWVMDLNRGTVRVYAGNGREDIADSTLADSSLAQTSGITTDGHKLYFADSETSSVRMADLEGDGQVKTIIGHGLFEFGDADGDNGTARFQHPLGILYHDGILFVADTYNNKIKLIDPINRNSRTFAGSGSSGYQDGPLDQAQFNEPGGLAFTDGKIYVADTNNHRIRVIDPKKSLVSTLNVHKQDKSAARTLPIEKFIGDKQALPVSGVFKAIELHLNFEKNYQLIMPTWSRISAFNEQGKMLAQGDVSSDKTILALKEPVDNKIYIEAEIYYCRHTGQGLCLVKNVLFEVPLDKRVKADPLNITFDLPGNDKKIINH